MPLRGIPPAKWRGAGSKSKIFWMTVLLVFFPASSGLGKML
jgi:hypothetical protein